LKEIKAENAKLRMERDLLNRTVAFTPETVPAHTVATTVGGPAAGLVR
jgi:hypothetical protein